MRKNWISTVVLVGVSMVAGSFLSQMWEPVIGQPGIGQSGGFSVETPTQVPKQVVVQQQTELPKCFVDFRQLPFPGGAPSQILVITVVDTEAKKLAMYHGDMSNGAVTLLSTRYILPDLMMDEYNARTPLPSEINLEIQRMRGINK
jgi:hypothetical protein